MPVFWIEIVIRWGRLGLLVAPLVLIGAATHFFLDRGIRRALEAAGTAAVGARVEVADVHTRFWSLSAVIGGVEVTDPEHPLTNALQIDTLRLRLRPKPLFWKKFVIEHAEILGIQTGTPRRFSGALPEKPKTKEKPSALAQAAKTMVHAARDNLKEAYDPKKWLAPENLASYQRVLAEKDRLTQTVEEWKQRSKKEDIDHLSRRVQELAEELKKGKGTGLDAALKVPALLKEAQSLRADIASAQKEIRSLGTDLAKEIADAKGTLREIDELRRKDIAQALAQMKSNFSADGLTKNLLGPAWFASLQRALRWMDTARRWAGKYSSPKETPAPLAPPREGKNILFPFYGRWPSVHLVHATLDGKTPRGVHYSGELMNLSSDPTLLGKPSTLNLQGRSGPQSLELSARMDLTAEEAKQSVSFHHRGLPLSGFPMGQINGHTVSLVGGEGEVKAHLEWTGPTLGGTLRLQGNRLNIALAEDGSAHRLGRVLTSVLTNIREAQVEVALSGPWTNPDVALRSSIDDQLKNAFRGAWDQETEKLRGEIEKNIAERVGPETEKISALIEKNSGAALEKLNLGNKNLASLETQLKTLTEQLAGVKTSSIELKNLKGLFKKNH